ncbi:hypothetical protein GCM10010372_76210 [Streptomyces tauricus]|nr:hypothetical protein GCM10010372_76210 [Streptomyces tauricus]
MYLIVQDVPDSATAAPFSLQFVQVPYDAEAELSVLRHRTHQGDLRSDATPSYHRRGPRGR